jgi:hypothetical protein
MPVAIGAIEILPRRASGAETLGEQLVGQIEIGLW